MLVFREHALHRALFEERDIWQLFWTLDSVRDARLWYVVCNLFKIASPAVPVSTGYGVGYNEII